jgi:hypothetical protein
MEEKGFLEDGKRMMEFWRRENWRKELGRRRMELGECEGRIVEDGTRKPFL